MKTIKPAKAIAQNTMMARSKEKKLKKEFEKIFFMPLITSTTIVPRKPSEFDFYIQLGNVYQLKLNSNTNTLNWQRMRWSKTNSDAWDKLTSDWIDLYAKFNDPMQPHPFYSAKVTRFIKDFHAFARNLILKCKASDDIVTEDGDVYHFVIKRKKYNTTRTKIEAECYAKVILAGLGNLKLKVYSKTDAGKASILRGAQGFEFAYLIIEPDEKQELLSAQNLFPDSRYRKVNYKKANITHDFDIENSGKLVQIFFRWIIFNYPQLSGPWSQMITRRIP